MERLPVTMRVDTTKTTERGISISVSKLYKRRTPPGQTALHEAAHVEAAGQIFSATIVGTSEYLGATYPVVMTAAAAMAAEALGFDGTSHDRAVTKYGLGIDPDAAIGSAISLLAGRHDYMYAVASRLQEEGTIGQKDVDEVHKEVDDERQGIWDVAIHLKGKDGETNLYMRRSRNGEVLLPEGLVEKHNKPPDSTTTLTPGEWIVLEKDTVENTK
ncbi:MAG TPA: hypothetical protein VEW42_05605 [Candidatus Eisenbacteria bacterium]|nr:hypothetical protein [Candidatus Eisenbacteria bacterium]